MLRTAARAFTLNRPVRGLVHFTLSLATKSSVLRLFTSLNFLDRHWSRLA